MLYKKMLSFSISLLITIVMSNLTGAKYVSADIHFGGTCDFTSLCIKAATTSDQTGSSNTIAQNIDINQDCKEQSFCGSFAGLDSVVEGKNNLVTQNSGQGTACTTSDCSEGALLTSSVTGDNNIVDQQSSQRTNCSGGSTCSNTAVGSVNIVGSGIKSGSTTSQTTTCSGAGSSCSNSASNSVSISTHS